MLLASKIEVEVISRGTEVASGSQKIKGNRFLGRALKETAMSMNPDFED